MTTEATQDNEGLPPKTHNEPPLEDRLALDYMERIASIAAVAARATAAPKVITDEDGHAVIVGIVKDARQTSKATEAERVAEKAPFLEAERKVDTFFKPLTARCDTVITAMEKRIKAWLDSKAAAERARRDEEARQAREAERMAREEANKRLAEAASAKANADVHETKMVEAASAAAVANAHGADARAAERSADARPADLARTRTTEGLATLTTFWDFEVQDWDSVSLVKLRDFIPRDAIEKAIRAYVKLHGGSKPLPGVNIFENTRANVR